MAASKKMFQETVARKLIEQLEKGTAPWQRPWQSGESGFLPFNLTTGKRYRGVNVINLMSKERPDPRWLTYKQAEAMGAQVRKGEKGTPIQYWRFTKEQTQTGENGKPVLGQGKAVKQLVRLERPRMFLATVFNAGQIEGLPPPAPPKKPEWQAVERAELILLASGIVIHHDGQNRAFYRPATDSIHLPGKEQFPTAENYYATALHELGHATGHASRLARDLVHPFGSEGYAREELRAEIASMLLGGELGLGHDPEQHAAYVGSWIKVLQDDPLEIFRAAAAAEKIQDYVLGWEQPQIQEQTDKQNQAIATRGAEIMDQPRQRSEALGLTLPHDGNGQTNIRGMALPAGQVTPEEGQETFIEVPFKEKNEAKALGAKWDRQNRSWYLPAGIETAPFAKWAVAKPEDGQSPRVTQNPDARKYLAVPYGERQIAKAAGAKWDKAAKSWYAGPAADMAGLARWQPANVSREQGPAMTPEEEFAEALRFLGCKVSGKHPVMDGKGHRITIEGEKFSEKAGSGFYVGHLDGHPAGYIKNNRTGVEMKWKSKGYTFDPELKSRLVAEAVASQQARMADQAKLHEQTAQRVSRQMAELKPIEQPTPYMRAKGIEPWAGVFTDGKGQKTYIPATDVNGKIWTVQYIREDGSKRFAKDSRKDGCFHAVGGLAALAQAPALVISEGYATASSLAQCLGFATVAAFDSGNLPHVAKALHDKFPGKPVIVAGDDDRHLEGSLGVNPGRSKAREAAKATGGWVLLPIFAPGEQDGNPKRFTDFNDLANISELGRDGLDRQVRAVVFSATRPDFTHREQQKWGQQEQRQSKGIKIG